MPAEAKVSLPGLAFSSLSSSGIVFAASPGRTTTIAAMRVSWLIGAKSLSASKPGFSYSVWLMPWVPLVP